jgi:nitric oxide reductase large subunit
MFTNVSTGIESLFIKEAPGAVRTTVPGVPAVPTMACFVLIALSGIFYSWKSQNSKANLFLGSAVLVIGSLAVLGYIFNLPILYYSFTGYSSMAAHTAVLFVFSGISLILIKEKRVLGKEK